MANSSFCPRTGAKAGEEDSPGQRAAGQQPGGEHGGVCGEGAAVPWAGGGHAGPAQGPVHEADGVPGRSRAHSPHTTAYWFPVCVETLEEDVLRRATVVLLMDKVKRGHMLATEFALAIPPCSRRLPYVLSIETQRGGVLRSVGTRSAKHVFYPIEAGPSSMQAHSLLHVFVFLAFTDSSRATSGRDRHS